MKNIKAVVWDLDNTLYKFSDDYLAACNWASAKAFLECGVPLSLEQAYDASWESFRKYHMSGTMLIERYNLDRAQYFKGYHENLDEKAIEHVFALEDHFKKSPYVHAILSHGSHEWAARALKRIGLQSFFKDEHILGFEEYAFRHKSQHPDGLDMILQRLAMPAAQICFVEDSAKNLKIAKDMGMTTVFVSHSLPVPDENYIDHIIETPEAFFSLAV